MHCVPLKPLMRAAFILAKLDSRNLSEETK